MLNVARLTLTLVFLLWSLALLGSSGLVGWMGDGLAQLLAQIHLGWFATALAGIGKALIFILWLMSAMLYALGFALTGRIGRMVQDNVRASEAQGRASSVQMDHATVTLERAPDGSYR